MQCGRYYYPQPAVPSATAPQATGTLPLESALFQDEPVPRRSHQRQPGGMVGKHTNRLIEARESRDKEWKLRHQAVIHYLDRGYEVGEIAARTGSSPRKIRTVREIWAGSNPC